MAEVVFDDILEQILIRLELKQIIRCKIVCKSWFSLISTSGFANSHVKHINNNGIGCHRRIVVDSSSKNNLVGSSNGLVCIFTSDSKLCVLNPSTRELKALKNHPDFVNDNNRISHLNGFGYDSSSHDYKVIVGRKHLENLLRVYLFSLKSNVWKVVGDFDFDLVIGSAGTLCNGALHWLMRDQNDNTKMIILSFDLSKEEFKTIPLPAKDRCAYTCHTRLGIIKESLCIFDSEKNGHSKWVMKNYNDKQSWELLILHWEKVITHNMKVLKLKSYYRTKTLFDRDGSLCMNLQYISAPVFVESLVSPHVNKIRKRKRIVKMIL